jgi:hypothetical protein
MRLAAGHPVEDRRSVLQYPNEPDELAQACETLESDHASRVCITRASKGAALWDNGELITPLRGSSSGIPSARATFMAGLMIGLTRGGDVESPEDACRVGAFVASHDEQYRCCRRRLFVRSSDPRSGSGGEGRRKGERLVRGATACGEMGTPQPHQACALLLAIFRKLTATCIRGCCSTGPYLVVRF